MQNTKAIYARAKLESRFWRKRLELSNSPFIRDIEAAGHRLGVHCRADASDAMRAYIWRKQCALVQLERQRAPWREIVNHGRELPLAMRAGA